MSKKILFLGAGSKNDPGFVGVTIEGSPYMDYMKDKGITVIDTVLESCHGCPDRMKGYSADLQKMVEEGHRVVAVMQGGVYFALPSIQGKDLTFPVISVPLDFVAYQGFILPSGHAVIAGTCVEHYSDSHDVNKFYERRRALKMADKILNFEGNTVAVSGGEANHSTLKLEETLKKYNIEISEDSDLLLTLSSSPKIIADNQIQIWADTELDSENVETIKKSHGRLIHQFNTIQVHGAKNLAIYAMKILSLQKPELRGTIKKIAEKKLDDYGPERDLRKEVFGGE
jgi:phosphoribosylcarboxyaminoimidazole (NCAIR) mutase